MSIAEKGNLVRLQLALNVDDLDTSVKFYEKMFDTKVAKRKPGYANFAIENPPLKLVLFEAPGEGGRLTISALRSKSPPR